MQTVKDALESAGFESDAFRFSSPSVAYHAALRDLRTTVKAGAKILVRPIPSPTVRTIRHQVTFELLESDNSLGYTKEMFTQFNKLDQSVAVEAVTPNADHDELIAMVEGAFRRRLTTVTDQEIRAFVVRQGHQMNSVACKPRGGIWFASNDYKKRLEQVAQFVDILGGQFYMQPIFDTADWRSDVSRFVDHDLKVEVDAINRKLEEQLRSGKPKKKALLTIGQNYSTLISKARSYERLLSYQAEHLREVCAEQLDMMEKAINGEVQEIAVQLSYKETQEIKKLERQAEDIAAAATIQNLDMDAPF